MFWEFGIDEYFFAFYERMNWLLTLKVNDGDVGIGAGTEVSFVFETVKPRSGITGLEDKLLQAEGA